MRFKDRKSGKDVNGNLEGIPSYTYKKMAKNSSPVIRWKSERFKKIYLGYEVDVLYINGRIAHGRTHLGTVRNTYLLEEL